MNRKSLGSIGALGVAALLGSQVAVHAQQGSQDAGQVGQGADRGQQTQTDRAGQAGDRQTGQAGQALKGQYAFSVEELIQGWPEPSKKAAKEMQQKYGQPNGMTPTTVVWTDKGPFKEIILRKEPIQHDFPKPHPDVLEHVVAYKVPADKFDELAAFDGSIIAERTRGTLAARCDSEPHNILALNLADDVVKGKKSVEEARQAYAETAKQMMKGQSPQIAQKLQFDPPQQAGDPGVAIIGKQAGQPDEAQPAGEQQPAQGQQQKPQE